MSKFIQYPISKIWSRLVDLRLRKRLHVLYVPCFVVFMLRRFTFVSCHGLTAASLWNLLRSDITACAICAVLFTATGAENVPLFCIPRQRSVDVTSNLEVLSLRTALSVSIFNCMASADSNYVGFLQQLLRQVIIWSSDHQFFLCVHSWHDVVNPWLHVIITAICVKLTSALTSFAEKKIIWHTQCITQ